jgi:hypothetical protein
MIFNDGVHRSRNRGVEESLATRLVKYGNNHVVKTMLVGGFNDISHILPSYQGVRIQSYSIIFNPIFSGWWYTYPCEKYEFVTWDDDIPNI